MILGQRARRDARRARGSGTRNAASTRPISASMSCVVGSRIGGEPSSSVGQLRPSSDGERLGALDHRQVAAAGQEADRPPRAPRSCRTSASLGRHHAVAVAPDRRDRHGMRRAASSASPVANDAAIAPCSSRALAAAVDEAARGLVVHGRRVVDERARARRGAAAPTCRSQCSQWNGARRSSAVDRHELQRAVLPGRSGLRARSGPTRITRETASGWRSARRTASGPPSEWPQTTAGTRVERAQRRGQVVGRRVERRTRRAARRSGRSRAGRARCSAPGRQQRHRAAPVLPGAAEPVQQHERRARARLGAGDDALRPLDAQRAEAGGEPGASQPGGSRGCARRSGSGP